MLKHLMFNQWFDINSLKGVHIKIFPGGMKDEKVHISVIVLGYDY